MKFSLQLFIICTIWCILLAQPAQGQTATKPSNGKTVTSYTVKKKDTLYGIARKHDVTIAELVAVNPGLAVDGSTVKKGDVLFIPEKQAAVPATYATANSNKQPTTSKQAATSKHEGPVRIGVMLPLHANDGDGKRMVEYYRGVLMACENMKREGISTEIKAWNIDINSDIRLTLIQEGARNCDVIFGPLYTKQVKPLADFCKIYDIKLVIPFSISAPDVNTNDHVFQVYQSPSMIAEQSATAFLSLFSNAHPVFIDCNDSTSQKGIYTATLRKKLEEKGITYNITNLKTSEESFAKAFDGGKKNVIVLNSSRSPELGKALQRIEALRRVNPSLDVTFYGYTEWLMYVKTYERQFHAFDTYIPTTFYYNETASSTQLFERKYALSFGENMMYALPHFALIGYDQAQFFVRGISKYGNSFRGNREENIYQPIQSPLSFEQIAPDAGMQNKTFMLIHYRTDGGLESLNY